MEAARVLAWYIMALRCRGAEQHLSAWLDALAGHTLDDPSKAAIRAFVKPGFGSPDSPSPDDHLYATVAEHLWFVLHLETAGHRGAEICHIEVPKLHITAPGGDGLVVHTNATGLEFRLWELKKHTGRSPVSRTVRRAYGQLGDRGVEYLAEYTSLGPSLPTPELRELYGRLVDAWVGRTPEAGAGVGLGLPEGALPRKCFSSFPRHFPELSAPPRLEGALAAPGSFQDFARYVRRLLWTGL